MHVIIMNVVRFSHDISRMFSSRLSNARRNLDTLDYYTTGPICPLRHELSMLIASQTPHSSDPLTKHSHRYASDRILIFSSCVQASMYACMRSAMSLHGLFPVQFSGARRIIYLLVPSSALRLSLHALEAR
jgi:hypothetical protein